MDVTITVDEERLRHWPSRSLHEGSSRRKHRHTAPVVTQCRDCVTSADRSTPLIVAAWTLIAVV